MSDAETILKLIETADPSNEISLDDIDGRVWAYLTLKGDFKISFNEGAVYYRHNSFPETTHTILHHRFQHPKYTRSRDALKNIRPQGWNVDILWSVSDLCQALCYQWNTNDFISYSGKNKTEELSELHAIIQAIAHERGQQ